MLCQTLIQKIKIILLNFFGRDGGYVLKQDHFGIGNSGDADSLSEKELPVIIKRAGGISGSRKSFAGAKL